MVFFVVIFCEDKQKGKQVWNDSKNLLESLFFHLILLKNLNNSIGIYDKIVCFQVYTNIMHS